MEPTNDAKQNRKQWVQKIQKKLEGMMSYDRYVSYILKQSHTKVHDDKDSPKGIA